MDKFIWLDSASTTKPKFFAKDYAQYWANPNSNHAAGLEANNQLNQVRERIMKALGVESGKVIIGGCASQLVDNLIRYIYVVICPDILGSMYEHNCVDRWLDCYKIGYSLTKINQGDIVCYMMTSNITGSIFPVEQIGKMCRNAGAYYIMDATATLGHYPIPTNLESFCDCLITSGHKYHAEKGLGFMWLSDRFVKFLGLSDDSHEEYGLISGTPNVPGAIALSYAMEHAVNNATSNWVEHKTLANKMLFDLQDEGIEARIICDESLPKAHSINALYLPEFNADALVNFLSSKNIYISPGHSACTSDNSQATRVLEAFGLTKEEASQTVRVSFGEDSTQEDINALVKGIVEFKEMFI